MSKADHAPKRILVMRYRFIGDTVLTVPFLRNLHHAYPDATIDMLVAPNSGEILKYCPYVNQLIYFDTTRKHRYEYKSGAQPRSFWSYVKELREKKYDTAFVLKRSFSSATLAFLAGIPRRIGYDTEHRKFLLTQAVPYHEDRHEMECFLDVLRAAHIPVQDTHLESWWSDAEEQQINDLTRDIHGHRHIMLHLTASNPEKEWSEHLFFHVAQWLIETFDATLHCVGAASDTPKYQNLDKTLNTGDTKRFYNWCGQTQLLESMSLIKRMQLVVGVDSGVLHMAASANIPVVGLLNPENADKWSPLGNNSITITDKDPNQTLSKVQDACQTLLTPATL